MEKAIEINNLTKTYGDVVALKNISLSIEKDVIYGLLGRNGAGKTTLLKLITSQIIKDEGSIKVFGEEVYENQEVLSNLCFFSADKSTSLMGRKIKNIFSLVAPYYKNWDKKFAKELCQVFQLDINKRYNKLSSGMKSMVNIIIGLASRAPITIFDEPYVGLDAAARSAFYDFLIKDYTEYPRTIILSTHLIDEMERLFERTMIIKNGELLIEDETENIKMKGFYISGNTEKLNDCIKNKKVIHEEGIGKLKTYGVFNGLSEDEIQSIKAEGIEVMPMSLEKLFVYITETK